MIIEDSISDGKRITTMLHNIPKFVNAQLNTHGRIAISAESSRARPTSDLIAQVISNPYVPRVFPAEGKGMIPRGVLSSDKPRVAWLRIRDQAIRSVEILQREGVHKELTNRLLEPWLFQAVLMTATEWDNFLHLRLHSDAQGAMQDLAAAVAKDLESNTPVERRVHLPFLVDDERERPGFLWSSANRCKRISYGRQGIRKDFDQEVSEAQTLIEVGHMGPFEHPAFAGEYSGKFLGWVQARKIIPYESDPLGEKK